MTMIWYVLLFLFYLFQRDIFCGKIKSFFQLKGHMYQYSS